MSRTLTGFCTTYLWVYCTIRESQCTNALRVQMAFILMLAGATPTRPDALVGNVLYKHVDVEFQIFSSRPPGIKGVLVGLVLDLTHMKANGW